MVFREATWVVWCGLVWVLLILRLVVAGMSCGLGGLVLRFACSVWFCGGLV